MPGQFLYLTVQHFLLFKHVSELSQDSFMAEDMPKKNKQTNKTGLYIYAFLYFQHFLLLRLLNSFFQLRAVDFENNPELKRLQFLAPGPKMAGLTKGTLPTKKDQLRVKQGRNN